MQNEWEGNPLTLASYSSPSGDTFPSAQRAVAPLSASERNPPPKAATTFGAGGPVNLPPLNPLNQPARGGPNLLNLGRTAAPFHKLK